MEKVEYKKAFKELYLPKNQPVLVEVPSILFAVIDGQGDPNEEAFSVAVNALYGFSYTVKMSYKSKEVPTGFYDYTVFPLEGVWDLVDKSIASTDKSNYAYAVMIRQPDFLTPELFDRFILEAKSKKANEALDRIRLETINEGWCCQMLHMGSYDEEPASFEMMKQFCADNGYERASLKHREIYLSDPRKTETSKLKTVLRFKVRKTIFLGG